MVGGSPLKISDTTVKAGGAGAGAIGPLTYGHLGGGGVGQLVTQARTTAVYRITEQLEYSVVSTSIE